MIDFRYHIVSLISVFLALAVGIVLGAGPLKESIGDQLTGQVDQLRSEKDALRTELDAAHAGIGSRDAFLTEVSDDLVAGVLADRNVAVLALDEVQDVEREALAAQIAAAGGTVTVQGRLADQWTDPKDAKFRQSLATTLTDLLEEAPERGGVDAELAYALAQAVTDVDPADPTVFSAQAALLQEILVDGELAAFSQITAPADVVVLLAGPQEDTDDEAVQGVLAIQVLVATAMQVHAEAAVVAGPDAVEGGLLSAVREGAGPAQSLSTVEGVDELAGQVSVPLALAARITGVVGHYGPGQGATAVAPPRVVPAPVDRTPRAEEAETPGETADAETPAAAG